MVIDIKEKGSDVNLATELLVDAFNDMFDVAAIVTNDSDLASPIRAVCHLAKTVGVINPHKRPSFELTNSADFVKPVRPWVLRQSQFPPVLPDKVGEIHKPSEW